MLSYAHTVLSRTGKKHHTGVTTCTSQQPLVLFNRLLILTYIRSLRIHCFEYIHRLIRMDWSKRLKDKQEMIRDAVQTKLQQRLEEEVLQLLELCTSTLELTHILLQYESYASCAVGNALCCLSMLSTVHLLTCLQILAMQCLLLLCSASAIVSAYIAQP